MRVDITTTIQNPLVRAVVWFGRGAVDAIRELLRSTADTLGNVLAFILLLLMLLIAVSLIFVKNS